MRRAMLTATRKPLIPQPLYVAVGASGKIATSPDGVSWTARSSGVTGALRAVAYDPRTGRYVAVGSNCSTISLDGLTWTGNNAAFGAGINPQGVCYSTLLGEWITSSSSDGLIYTSLDGITWTSTAAVGQAGRADFTEAHGKLYALRGDLTRVVSSSDGVTWADSSPAGGGMASGLSSLARSSAGRLAAVGYVYDGAFQPWVVSSSDGATWADAATPPTGSIARICWSTDLGAFVAVNDSRAVFTSGDADMWSSAGGSVAFAPAALVAPSGLGLLIAAGASGNLATSPTGATWTARTSGFGTSAINALC